MRSSDRHPLNALSDREREVLACVLEGHTYHSAARLLGLSPHTVDTYMRRVRAKTGITNRMQLLLLAMTEAPGETTDEHGDTHPDRR
ncbi:response regulator transcription factor [Streptomyces sp. NPDC060000]|uniref:response regulator transcription factor n=1 Tax=Streptomyces sp. NPDC060000 TaxID=3347031 RepID=UPI00367848D6